MAYNKHGGVYPSGAGYTVPRGPAYNSWLEQAYGPDWRQTVFQGGRVPQPGERIMPGQPGYGGGTTSYRSMFNQADPRAIMEGDAFKQLVQMAGQGSGALAEAKGTMGPSIEYLRNMLQSPAPLGTGRGDLVRQQGVSALQNAIRTGARGIDEESSRFGSAYNPEAAAFSKGLLRARGAEGYSTAVSQGQQVSLQEKEMNERFRQALASVLSNVGMGLGGLAQGEFAGKAGAAQSAGQLESFARNTWAELLARLLGGGGPIQYNVEERGRAREYGRDTFPQFPMFQMR